MRARERRWMAVKLAYSHVPAVVRFWASVMDDPAQPIEARIRVSELLMDRAVGRVPTPVAVASEQREHRVLEIRWRSPDPSDTSNIIEPEPIGGGE